MPARSRPVFGFKARKRLDLNAGYDVTEATGQPIGEFRKDFAASLLAGVVAYAMRAGPLTSPSEVAMSR